MKKRDNLQKAYRYFGDYKQNNAKKCVFGRKKKRAEVWFSIVSACFFACKFQIVDFCLYKIGIKFILNNFRIL